MPCILGCVFLPARNGYLWSVRLTLLGVLRGPLRYDPPRAVRPWARLDSLLAVMCKEGFAGGVFISPNYLPGPPCGCRVFGTVRDFFLVRAQDLSLDQCIFGKLRTFRDGQFSSNIIPYSHTQNCSDNSCWFCLLIHNSLVLVNYNLGWFLHLSSLKPRQRPSGNTS